MQEVDPDSKTLQTLERAGSTADDLAALAMVDLFRRHLETINARCKRVGVSPVKGTPYPYKTFASPGFIRAVN